MPIVLDGTNGITTPDVESTGPIVGTTGAFSGNVTANGVATELRPLVLGAAQASTSGTGLLFSGIPSWAKRVTLMFRDVSVSAADTVFVQLGTSSAIAGTGYSGTIIAATSIALTTTSVTVGLPVYTASGTVDAFSGNAFLTKVTEDTWSFSASAGSTNTRMSLGSGSFALSGPLERIQLTTSGATFDAGTINVMYE